MKSRKMVLMNLFEGNNGDADIGNRHAHRGCREEGEGGTNEESSKDTYTLPYVK